MLLESIWNCWLILAMILTWSQMEMVLLRSEKTIGFKKTSQLIGWGRSRLCPYRLYTLLVVYKRQPVSSMKWLLKIAGNLENFSSKNEWFIESTLHNFSAPLSLSTGAQTFSVSEPQKSQSCAGKIKEPARETHHKTQGTSGTIQRKSDQGKSKKDRSYRASVVFSWKTFEAFASISWDQQKIDKPNAHLENVTVWNRINLHIKVE